jgi:hypothetical protein
MTLVSVIGLSSGERRHAAATVVVLRRKELGPVVEADTATSCLRPADLIPRIEASPACVYRTGSNKVGGSGALDGDPVNAWFGTLLLAIAVDLNRPSQLTDRQE